MQYCFKCKNVVEDKIPVCPHCKRGKTLREVKYGDSVYFQKVTEFEASELEDEFIKNAITYEIMPFSMGYVSSIYDSEIMPTDKMIYVNYEDLERANKIFAGLYSEEEMEEELPEIPTKKRIFVQVVSVIAFLTTICLVVLATDFVANSLKNLFT